MTLSELKIGDVVVFNQHPYHYLGKKVYENRMSYLFTMELKEKQWTKALWTNERTVERHELKKNKDGQYEW